MLLRVDPASALPLHEQLAGQLRGAIAGGDLEPGDRLPAAKELAASLDVNVHTLLRAIQALRDEGLLDVRRGRGTVVTDAAPDVVNLAGLAAELVQQARHTGLTNQAIVELVEAQL